MTVPTTTNKAIGTGDGLATVFPFTFGTLPTGDLVVTLFDLTGMAIPQTEVTDYTVLGKGAEDGGSVVFGVAPPPNYTVLIQRILPTTQPDDLKNQGSYYPRTVERMFDRRAMVDQQLQETIGRTLTLPPQVQGVSTLLPAPAALNLIGWDADADELRNFTPGDIGTTLAFSNFIADKFIATPGQMLFPLTADPGALANLDVSIDGVTQVPTTDYTYLGAALTFVNPMVGGESVLIRYGTALPTGITDSSAVLFTQAGPNAVTRTMRDKLREVELSIVDYATNPASLVIGLEAADTAWLRAQTALDTLSGGKGGTIRFPRGLFVFNDTMRIGNRTTGASTLNGVRVVGAGRGRSAQTMNASDGATILRYNGPGDSRPFIYIDGPISGTTVEDLFLDCNGKDVVPIRSMRSFHESVRNILGVNWCNNFAVEIGANTPNVGYGGAAPIGGLWEHVEFQSPGVGAHGVDICNGNGNVNQWMFLRCYFDRYNSTSTIGVRLGYCDHIQFIGCHIAQTGASGNTGISYMVRSQPGLTNFPANIEVIGGSQAGGCSFDNTLATWNGGPYPAIDFRSYKTADGAPVPPKTANGGADAPGFMFTGITDNGIKFGWTPQCAAQVVTAASTISPVSEVVLLQTTVAVDIATINIPRPAFSVANGNYRITLIPTYTESPSVFIRLVTGGNIAVPMLLKNLVAVTLVYNEGTGLWSTDNGAAASGRYTPSHSALTNISASTPRECQWMRVGNTVHVSGRLEATTTTAAGTATSLEMSLPITPASFVNNWELAGTGATAGLPATPNQACLVLGSGLNARIQWQCAQTGAQGVFFTFSYRLV